MYHTWKQLLTYSKGIQNSGKTIFSRQLYFLHGYELLDEERGKYRSIILQNILEAFLSIQHGKGPYIW